METNTDLKDTWQIVGTPYRPKKYSLMQKVLLGDSVIISNCGFYDGVVTLINIKGIGVYTNDGYKFVKWCNVISKSTK